MDLANTLNYGLCIAKTWLATDRSSSAQASSQPSLKHVASDLNSTVTIQSKFSDTFFKYSRMIMIFLLDKKCRGTFDELKPKNWIFTTFHFRLRTLYAAPSSLWSKVLWTMHTVITQLQQKHRRFSRPQDSYVSF